MWNFLLIALNGEHRLRWGCKTVWKRGCEGNISERERVTWRGRRHTEELHTRNLSSAPGFIFSDEMCVARMGDTSSYSRKTWGRGQLEGRRLGYGHYYITLRSGKNKSLTFLWYVTDRVENEKISGYTDTPTARWSHMPPFLISN
jgi:hypothetical protein